MRWSRLANMTVHLTSWFLKTRRAGRTSDCSGAMSVRVGRLRITSNRVTFLAAFTGVDERTIRRHLKEAQCLP